MARRSTSPGPRRRTTAGSARSSRSGPSASSEGALGAGAARRARLALGACSFGACSLGAGLAGCAAAEGADTGEPAAGDSAAAAAPQLSVEEVEAALGEAADLLLALDLFELQAFNEDALAASDGACPEIAWDGGSWSWTDDCETTDGARFSGRSSGWGESWDGGAASSWEGSQEVALADGRALALSGSFALTSSSSGEDTEVAASMMGVAEGSGFGGGWLELGLSSTLFLQGARGADGAISLAIEGGAAGPDGGGTFYLRSLTVDSAGAWGEAQIRGGDGEWYGLTLDGADCGSVSWRGEGLGEACVDLSGLRSEESWIWR